MHATYWRDTGVLEVAGSENDSDEVIFEVPCDDHQIGDILEQRFGADWSAIPLDFEEGGDAYDPYGGEKHRYYEEN
jgi:hypothetical protein